MLTISGPQLQAIAADARIQLRTALRRHWRALLPGPADAVGEAVCEQLLDETQQLADEDPTLDLADLMMIADLQLVALANERRGAQH